MKEENRHFGLDFIKIKKKNVLQDVNKMKREAKLKWAKFRTNTQQRRYTDGNKHTKNIYRHILLWIYKLKQH